MPIITYPMDSDAWSESLTPAEGNWSPAAGEVVLDRVNKAVGEASIKTYSEVYNYYVASRFKLHDGKEFDATGKDAKLHFLHALQTTFTGNCSIVLYDRAEKSAYKPFGTTPTQEWELKEFPVGPGTGWDEENGFDWTHVKIIRIDCWQQSGQGGGFWVDSPHFTFEAVLPTLIINSVPTGKNFTIDSLAGVTPAAFNPDPDVTYTVSIEAEDFKNWENASTDPTRKVTLREGEEKTITAYYEGVAPPPVDWLPIILVGSIVAGIIGIVLFMKST